MDLPPCGILPHAHITSPLIFYPRNATVRVGPAANTTQKFGDTCDPRERRTRAHPYIEGALPPHQPDLLAQWRANAALAKLLAVKLRIDGLRAMGVESRIVRTHVHGITPVVCNYS